MREPGLGTIEPPGISPGRPHRPAVAAVVSLGAGIAIDRLLDLPLLFWLGLAFASLVLSVLPEAFRRHFYDWPAAARWANVGLANGAFSRGDQSRILQLLSSSLPLRWASLAASLCALLAVFAIGGLREHVSWRMCRADSIAGIAQETPAPVRLRGVIATPVEMVDAKIGPRIPPWMEVDQSLCLLRCESLESGARWENVSGLLRMSVTGHLVHVRVGDRVEVLGQLALPAQPQNPGGWNFREYLHSQGIAGVLRVEHPVSVSRLGLAPGWGWALARARESIRSECLQLLTANLSAEQAGLASSLLIGSRNQLPEDVEEQFAQSGAMHLLAISGLHVGILLGLVLMISRLANLSTRETSIVLLLTIGGYLLITDLRPPVLRAGLLAGIAVLGWLQGTRVDAMNALAVSALALLLWHPADLFDLGAQLSFLAVWAILWSARWQFRLFPKEDAALAAVVVASSWWWRWLASLGRTLFDAWKMTVAVMFATWPLTMTTFHLITPIGLGLNLVLIPYFTIVLALGYLLMFGGLALPAAAPLLAIPFHWSLSILQLIVRWGQAVPWGHLYLPTIPAWWLWGFYLLLAAAWQLVGTMRTAWWSGRLLAGWLVLGLLLPLNVFQRSPLRCSFLAVGHGLATVLEFPGGETVLYDCGTIGDGERAARTVSQTLWNRGISRLDAVIVSHADHDHFSGLFGLLKKVPASVLLVSPTFLDFRQQGVEELCELAADLHIPIRLLQQGDRLQLRTSSPAGAEVEVLYPPPKLPDNRSDNASSVVLRVGYAGRSLLLTGDLEQQGLAAVVALPPQRVDVLLSPHHGGKVPNVMQLYDWAQPRYAVVSSSARELPSLSRLPAGCPLFNTAVSGAVTFEVAADGAIRVQEYLPNANKAAVPAAPPRP